MEKVEKEVKVKKEELRVYRAVSGKIAFIAKFSRVIAILLFVAGLILMCLGFQKDRYYQKVLNDLYITMGSDAICGGILLFIFSRVFDGFYVIVESYELKKALLKKRYKIEDIYED